ncbi:protein of unknown function DUF302, partial [Sideroxydans sp. CL21]
EHHQFQTNNQRHPGPYRRTCDKSTCCRRFRHPHPHRHAQQDQGEDRQGRHPHRDPRGVQPEPGLRGVYRKQRCGEPTALQCSDTRSCPRQDVGRIHQADQHDESTGRRQADRIGCRSGYQDRKSAVKCL